MNNQKLVRLVTLSRRIKWLVVTLMTLTLGVLAYLLLASRLELLLPVPRDIGVQSNDIGLLGWGILMLVVLLRPGAYLTAFWCVYRLLGHYERGQVFSRASVCWIRRIGYALVAIDVAALVQSALTGPLLTHLGLTPGYFSLQIGSSHFVVGIFVVLIGHIMELGRELKTW